MNANELFIIQTIQRQQLILSDNKSKFEKGSD